ncbi:kinase-like domain-containing protein [Boeremia exigua]|uniref:kinase-like domain-containing protein n=1 Tax=Boeremia exigua TaxID=749465 RepID=UPI001E8CBAC3|nr:kinase-like domain-containing protein [Boeremia exigua]KAH6615130.1 kinase-like domain-containing protein [Boeremia exigua]
MSMFRRPGDSSSSSEASFDQTEDEEPELAQDSLVTRANAMESSTSEIPANTRPSLADMRGFSTQDIQALGFHAMLEQNAVTAAAARLGVGPTDPEAQRQGREAYQRMARQLPEGIDSKYAGDEFITLRSTMQDGINQTTSAHLNTIAAAPDTQSLIMRHRNRNAAPGTQPPLPGIKALSDLPAIPDPWLGGYADLQNDRYARDFSELEIVGKGGYGKVFKVKHKLDGSFYAVKRINVPPAKLAKARQNGPDALNSILEEVRSLAKFDHANIVRYHNAWLEYTTAPIDSVTETYLPNNRLLEDKANFSSSPSEVSHLQAEFDHIQFGEPSDHGADILFEASNTGGAEDSRGNTSHLSLRQQLSVRRRDRRTSQASQATIATISSTKSRMSAVEDVSENYDDEEVEMIQRRHMPVSHDLTTDLSDSMISHSDMPGPLISARSTGPVLTLNVQMSLYESNLAAFIAPDRASFSSKPSLTHCFHPCVSLELMSNILSGVEYLHSQGVVHRDLKPANIFLALSTGRRPPYGSVDLSTCKPCSDRECVYVVPRIGDFGLVAALDESCTTSPGAKPVGTEFYRPETSARTSDKLDVFALGVIAVEMLHPFGTRMERHDTLSRLKKGAFPDGFADALGPLGDRLQLLIGAMVLADEEQRMGCEEARNEIARLVDALREE